MHLGDPCNYCSHEIKATNLSRKPPLGVFTNGTSLHHITAAIQACTHILERGRKMEFGRSTARRFTLLSITIYPFPKLITCYFLFA